MFPSVSFFRKVTVAAAVALCTAMPAVFPSCSATGNKNCTSVTDVFVYADICSSSTRQVQEVVFDMVQGVENDMAWMDTVSVSSLTLPLRPNNETTSFVLKMQLPGGKRAADTLTFFHTNRPLVISMECGGIVTHTIEKVTCTHHRIDSVVVVKPEVENVKTTHLNIWVP